MKTMQVMMAVAALAAMVVLSGCQMPGQVLSKEVCPACPKCKAVTTTGIIKGTTVTTVVCPHCLSEFEDHRVLDYAGTAASGKGMYHCDKCGKNYAVCPNCLKK